MTMTKKARDAEDVEHAKEILADIRPGETVYTVLRHVSSSGMTRWIDAYVIRNNEPKWISWAAAKLIGYPVNTRNHDGVEMGGCGMDMGFALVYSLSRRLFRDGFDCTGDHCPSNDHSNPPYPKRDGQMRHDGDGGYALNHRWL